MKQLGTRKNEERHVANQVHMMVWSHRLDLLALSNFKGDVQVHRLQWQKVWNLPPPQENVTVDAMAWRPDGTAIAVGYSSGWVHVVDLEDKEVLFKFKLEVQSELIVEQPQNITCITWEVNSSIINGDPDSYFYDDPFIYLMHPSASNKNDNNEDDTKYSKKIEDQNQLNMLITAHGNGNIDMRIFGTTLFANIKLSQLLNNECNEYKILDIKMTDNFSSMHVLYIDCTLLCVSMAIINTSVLNTYSVDIFNVAKNHSHILQMLTQLDQTMVSINEAWEHILLEMDTKMADYAASVPDGGVSADFLELLMMGVPSDELELFLLQELTAKGLKKFGSSVELSYSTIQKLVVKQLNIIGQSLVFFLSELRGHARMPDRLKIMGLDEETVNAAIKASFGLLNKCLEMQQVIDVSMRNYKTFFRWLFVVIVRLLDEQTPSEIVKISQQDVTHIAEFLYNFDSVKVEKPDGTTDKTVKFNLERLGQYLQNKDLTLLPEDDSEDNPWRKFLKENPCFLEDNETIYSVSEFQNYSLVQQQDHLKQAISKVFDVDKEVENNFTLIHNIKCYDVTNSGNYVENVICSQQYDTERQCSLLAILDRSKEHGGLNFISINGITDCMSVGSYCFLNSIFEDDDVKPDELVHILDLHFYSPELLSLLVKHPSHLDSSILLQLPIKLAQQNAVETVRRMRSCVINDSLQKIDLTPHIMVEGVYKLLDKMDGYKIAVSGERKVAVVLAKNKRKVRVFVMEGDIEDDFDNENNSHQRSNDSCDISENTTSNMSMSTDA